VKRRRWLGAGLFAGLAWQIRRRQITYMLPGRVALITGASSGIGAALAQKLAARGVRVLLVARSTRRLHAVALGINTAGGHADVYPADLSDPAAVSALAAQILQEQGAPDLLINNAGGGGWSYIAETSATELVDALAVPFFAAANLTRAFLPAMLERGEGVIVNITSPAAYLAFAGAAPYSVARWAMRAFDQALRADLYGSGVRTLLAVPGEVASTYWEHHPEAAARRPAIRRFMPALTPAAAAVRIADAIERGEVEAIFPLTLKLALWAWRLAPRAVERLVWGMGNGERGKRNGEPGKEEGERGAGEGEPGSG
jgi:short-subunit dehydrogenase